ncbi:MAG TPA: hypothetical protein VFX79_00415 [Candidatus Saccharimonadales bacterium]|nr:hypothetical protein [Candidatus Saccharimonadales bacterium]
MEDRFEKGRGPGFNDTQEFLAISGGDGDYTGVYPQVEDKGSEAPPAGEEERREPMGEEERFPSRSMYAPD